MNDIYLIIGLFLISLFVGFLSIRAVNRFMEDKIEQWSFEYQVFGFGGALLCVFGLVTSIGLGLRLIVDYFYFIA